MTRSYKTPKGLTERLLLVNTERRLLRRKLEELEREERALLAQGRELLREQNLPNYALSNGVAIRRVTKPIATILDFETLVRDALKQGHLEVIHKRVSPTQIEKLAYDNIHFNGVSLDHREEATLYVPKKVRE